MPSGGMVCLRAQDAKDLAWPERVEGILLEGLLETETAYEQAFERLRKLHPKLKPEAVGKLLRPRPREHGPLWVMASFWEQELDSALVGGILGGAAGRRAAIDRIHEVWPKLDPQMLQRRLEALAEHGTPLWARGDFWNGKLRDILLEGVDGGKEAERKAVDKILRLHPELRPGVVMAQLRRVQDERRKAEGRRGKRFPWTKDLLDLLREACETAGVPAAVDRMQSRTGWPRDVILRKARQILDIEATRRHQSAWAASEKRYLIENANHKSTRAMARELHRSVASVTCKMKRLGLSTAREEGFTISKLAAEWHVRRAVIRQWITLNWLKRGKDGRIPERAVRSFCRKHRDELSWNKLEVHTRVWVLEFSSAEEDAEEESSAAGAG
jgi:hypothetical protein